MGNILNFISTSCEKFISTTSNRLSSTFKKFYGRHTDLVGQYKKNVCQMFADSISWNDFYF